MTETFGFLKIYISVIEDAKEEENVLFNEHSLFYGYVVSGIGGYYHVTQNMLHHPSVIQVAIIYLFFGFMAGHHNSIVFIKILSISKTLLCKWLYRVNLGGNLINWT